MDDGTTTVTSADGTRIAYRRTGSGPAVVLVGGGLDDGAENAPLADALADRFTVFNYARRGRGASGDTAPYAVRREIEDLTALVDEAGGSAHVLGASSGGALALEAAAAGVAVARLVVYDVPYSVGESDAVRWRAYRSELDAALADCRPAVALAAFMRLGGARDEDIAGASGAPFWPALVALAPTLAHDAAVLGESGAPPAERLAGIRQEVLLLTRSPPDPHLPALGVDFLDAAAVAPVVVDFLAGTALSG